MVIQVENYEVYALTWDDVFKSFELRHAPLLKRLNYDREKLAKELMKEIENEEGRDKVNALTNIAIAIIKYPDITKYIKELVIMGGAVVGGNATPSAEFNIYVDPHAAETVFCK